MLESLWEPFRKKDYHATACEAARILRESGALEAIHLAGLSLIGLNRMEEGIDWVCASLALADAQVEWYCNAAVALMDKEQYQIAETYLAHGIKKFETSGRLHYISGLNCIHQHKWSEALSNFNKVLELEPAFSQAKLSKGFSYHMLGEYDQALATYASMTDFEGEELEELVSNVACVMLEQGKQVEALELLNQKYPLSKKAGTVYNKSVLNLGLKNWPEGWDMYEYRGSEEVKTHNVKHGIPDLPFPKAKVLDDVKGGNLFLYHEQGLGDTLQFVRYAKLLRPLVKSLTIGVPKQLCRLVERLDLDGQEFKVEIESAPESFCDVAISIMSCPMLFRQTIDNIPAPIPYFKVPVGQILQPKVADYPRVGLVWAGASRPDNIRAHNIDRRRSIPFHLVRNLIERFSGRIEFVSLQMPNHHILERGLMLQPIEEYHDLLDTAGVIQGLDLVVAIDSSIVHLAGALGKPVWMLSRFDACWRWHWDGSETTPWYPTMKIYRQKAAHTWPEVMERVSDDLMGIC